METTRQTGGLDEKLPGWGDGGAEGIALGASIDGEIGNLGWWGLGMHGTNVETLALEDSVGKGSNFGGGTGQG